MSLRSPGPRPDLLSDTSRRCDARADPLELDMIRATLALSALLLGPWLFRAIALFESPRAVQWNDLRGFTADAAPSLFKRRVLRHAQNNQSKMLCKGCL